MAGALRHLLNRNGRFFARLTIPKPLRPHLQNHTELRIPLGPDRREAVRLLAGAVAQMQEKLAAARRAAGEETAPSVPTPKMRVPKPRAIYQLYQDLLFSDDFLRDREPDYAELGSSDTLITPLKAGAAGRLDDDELEKLIGVFIKTLKAHGYQPPQSGTPEWRTLARELCQMELEVLARINEREQGSFTGTTSHPLLIAGRDMPEERPPVSLQGLLNEYLRSRKAIGKGRGAEARWTPVFANLVKFVGHDDARRLTKKNLLAWRDECLKTLSAKTVSDVYLASVRTVLKWATENDRIETNVAEKVRQHVPKKALEREQGFTDEEATRILRATLRYKPAHSSNPATREAPETVAAKRWAPLLCAFTGARITEITQLRKEDFRTEGDMHIMRITPAAGTVKAGGYRDVPLHPQIIFSGLVDYLEHRDLGPLFHTDGHRRNPRSGSTTTAGRISEWLRSSGLVPQGVSPNHGWRHRFKTVGREMGISDRVLDAIQGHAAKTAGDSYGDVTLKAKYEAISRFPFYDLGDDEKSR
ncbi:tyrosine-type recombinase/integrase [Segnochrobactrum spirostomi]|uniref:Tyrosine-type recombinase/integrase n=1 Tax=Segnochrobactrum spirostomi TaxID=2608987 RepID=A0A6A7Y2Q7_9HYPH|nr:tyrosine-type recombinase/integrase [Segnochrobactrum spirostomi]MQT12022.1 tyrosine-type recombinase/integrase [Segnochrobactrum spirostomi]